MTINRNWLLPIIAGSGHVGHAAGDRRVDGLFEHPTGGFKTGRNKGNVVDNDLAAGLLEGTNSRCHALRRVAVSIEIDSGSWSDVVDDLCHGAAFVTAAVVLQVVDRAGQN